MGLGETQVTGDWKNLHNVFFIRHCSGDHIKKHEIGRVCSTHGKDEKYLQGFDGKRKGQRPFSIPKRRKEDNINVNL